MSGLKRVMNRSRDITAVLLVRESDNVGHRCHTALLSRYVYR